MKTASSFHQTLRGLAIGVLAGLPLLAGAAGVTVDQQPLVVAEPLPPNILFIMDDSGSMAWQHMPGTSATWTSSPDRGLPYSGQLNNDIRLRAANVNTQWYDPTKNYIPWKNWDGTSWRQYNPKTENLPYDPSGEINTGSHSLRQTSYPDRPDNSDRDHSSTTSSTDRAFRFQGFYVYQSGLQSSNANYRRFDFRWNSTNSRWEGRACPATIWGTSTSLSDCTYYVGNTTLGPYGRTLEAEVQNYANWFSYYRLRASMAKASASRVFADLGEDFRVGYNTIWNRQNYRIPVGNDDGLFRGSNKQGWFTRLFNTNASNGTPLRQSLGDAGEYFRETGVNGPWGPQATAAQYSCRQNFTILTTDGYWNSDEASVSGARANNDGTGGSTITGPNGASYQYIAGRPYSDTRSNTLADVAMYYWKNDLRTDLKNDVPASAANPAFWQNMTTFGISIGLKGTLDPSTDLAALENGTKSWPNPTEAEDAERIDDLWHAAVNSRGEFIVASNADDFVDSLNAALGEIANRLGSGASLAANSTKLETGTRTFQAQYWSGTWRGELNAFQVNADGSLAPTPLWKASEQLPAWGSRNIWVHNPQGTGNNAYKLFEWGNLGSTQQAAIAADATTGAKVVDYLRGERVNEQTDANPTGTLRARTGLLGDVVNSQPVFVGTPNPRLYYGASFNGATAYATFAAGLTGRPPTLYVGGNDGMLHGFNTNTGAETYAFVPNAAILAGIKGLSSTSYAHQYFVDGEVTVADAYGGNSIGWRTVLIGSMGRGGRALFALDVTDPANVKFLWERDATQISALGNVLGKPVIAQVANGDWKVLIGNGPNSASDDASLIMIDVFTGSSTVVSTGVSGSNGLSAVYTWDSDGDRFIDQAYAGDLQGNLWRFTSLGGTPAASRLFVAQDGSGVAQPITAAPLAAKNRSTGDLWVFFGTGQYLNQADTTNLQVQSWYGLIDRGGTIASRTDLLERNILAEGEINGFGARVIEEGNAGQLIGTDGWFIDLESPLNGAEGERIVVPNQFQGPILVGTTRIPDGSDPCNPSGRGFIMAIDPFTGARLPQTFFDFTLDGSFNDADKLMVNGQLVVVSGIGFSASPNSPIFIEKVMQVSLDDGSTRTVGTQGTGTDAVRQSWREIVGQ